MTRFTRTLTGALAAVSLAAMAHAPAAAQDVPDDLTTMPDVPTDYQPERTAWGDPDLRGMFPIDNIASLPFQRPANFGDRFWLTEEEFAQRAEQATTVERLTPVGPDTLTYELTYADRQVWEAPFTLRVNWTRDDEYEFFEYACHEGNVQVRNYITANRSAREQEYERARMVEPIDPDAPPPASMDPASRGIGNQNDDD